MIASLRLRHMDQSDCVLGGYRKACVRFPALSYSSHLGLWDAGILTSALKQSGVTGGNGSKFIYRNGKIIYYIQSHISENVHFHTVD